MTVIYGIFVNNECYYIGQSRNIETRFNKHKEDIIHKRHTVKALNKVDIDDVEMRELFVVADNSFLTCIAEGCANSIYKPKNKIVWRAGRNCVTFKRIDTEIARGILAMIVCEHK